MFVLPGYDAFLGFLLIAAAVPVLALVTNKLLAPASKAVSESSPMSPAWSRLVGPGFNSIFAITCLPSFSSSSMSSQCSYPWAVAFHRLGLLAFIEALVFITILLVALAYAWRKGALEWS